MFSGKTEELIRRLRRFMYARQKFQVFKPARDDRDATDAVVTHLKDQLPCIAVPKASDIRRLLEPDVKVVGVDEAQFFDGEIVAVCEEMADLGIRVIVAGLDRDSKNQPFGPMPFLLTAAEHVKKLSAVCTVCGMAAHFSQLQMPKDQVTLDEAGNVIVVGSEMYEARCREHFTPA
jgi:thymidine kinase